jgi:hypothetical protein
MTFTYTTLSKKGLFVKLSMKDIQHNDTQHNKNAIMLCAFLLNVAIYLFLR